MILEAKTAAASLSLGVAGLFATGNLPQEMDSIRSIAELGSFGLIAFAVVYILVKVAPAFISHVDRTRDAFISELREERTSREKHWQNLDHDLQALEKSFRDLLNRIK